MLLRDLWGQPKARAHEEDSTGAAARGLLLLFPLKKCPRPPREMVFGVQHLRICGQKLLFGGGFLTPPSMCCELVTILIILEPTSTIRSSGMMLKWDPSQCTQKGHGERISTEIYKTHSFFRLFLGVLEEYCEAGNTGWMTVPCPWRWTTHSISVYNCDKKSGSYLFVVRKSSSAVRFHRSGSSWRQFLRRTTDEQCRTTRGRWTGVGLSNPKQLLLLPRRHSDLVFYNPFCTFFFFFSRVFVASCWSAQFDFGFLQIRPWKSYIYDLKSWEFEIRKLIYLEVSFAFAMVMNISS